MQQPTSKNVGILFLDFQEGIIGHSGTVAADKLTRAAAALSKLAALHKLPTFLSAVPPGGAYLDAVLAPLGNAEPRMRTETTAFADDGLVEGLKASGREVLILAGILSEVVVQRTALDALAAGYTVQIAVDACGGANPRTEDAAWRRIIAAGGITTSVTTFAAELAGDFRTELGGATLGIMLETLGG